MKTLAVASLVIVSLLISVRGEPNVTPESTVTLKSGETVQGLLVSDTTNDVLQIKVLSANRTISSLRLIPRADIQNIHTETPAEAAERVDYAALSKFQLDPDQEQSEKWYAQWIASFEKFLNDYPKSDKATIIQQRLEACQAERRHVVDGQVKFANKWMAPREKRLLTGRLAARPGDEEGMTAVKPGDGQFTVVERSGSLGWMIPSSKRPCYLYFAADDGFRPQTGWIVEIEVDYLDAGTGAIALDYDSTDTQAPVGGAYKRHAFVIRRTNTDHWEVARFLLDDARFRHLQNSRADFRFYNGGDDMLIRAVRVRRVSP